jgi:hypothetical protein
LRTKSMIGTVAVSNQKLFFGNIAKLRINKWRYG